MRRRFAILLLGVLVIPKLHAADHAVILLYHHVSDNTPASTSVSPQVFRQHLDFLAAEGFTVLPLGRILTTIANGEPVPDKTVAITFDDAYRSVMDNALPMLEKHHWPFTVFVSTRAIDEGYRNYLTWDELRKLVKAGAEIGSHSHSHDHLVRRHDGESASEWRRRVEQDIRRATQQLETELDIRISLFAYTFGEYSAALQEIVSSLGYFGITQQSGSVGRDFDRLAVPRFPMATNYADMDRFAISVNSRPLPVYNVTAGPHILTAGRTGGHRLAFNLAPGDYRSTALNCYDSSGERLTLTREDESDAVRITVPLPDWGAGRRKINCTAPSSKTNGVFFWYSHLWLVKQADGTWYEE